MYDQVLAELGGKADFRKLQSDTDAKVVLSAVVPLNELTSRVRCHGPDPQRCGSRGGPTASKAKVHFARKRAEP